MKRKKQKGGEIKEQIEKGNMGGMVGGNSLVKNAPSAHLG